MSSTAPRRVSRQKAARWGLGVAILIVLALAPQLFSDFWLSAIFTKALWLGIAAASLIFLAGYVGMVSLAQTALYGIAGFTLGNLVLADGGVGLEWDPWAGAIGGLVVAVLVGFIFGLIAARSEGIYFLMITLAFGVLTFFFFGQVTQVSGFGGVNNITAPGIVSTPRTDPDNIWYIALIASVAVYFFIRYLVRTPFGIALQGIRDDPTRMRALGYNVFLHRTLAFTVGAFIAGIAGILFAWWSTRIDPFSVAIGSVIDVLVIAVIGGIFYIEGAWLGALVFSVIDNEARNIGFVGERFNTLIGAIFLVIVLLSPGGLLGIWESTRGFGKRAITTWRKGEPAKPAAERR